MMKRFNNLSEDNQTNQPSEDPRNEVDVKLDRVNDLWMKLERKLLKEQPPRRIACQYDASKFVQDDGAEWDQSDFIGIQRYHGKWRICYGSIVECQSGQVPDNWKPITECDLETRIDATKGIDKLKFEVANTRAFFIPALDEAIEQLENAILDEE
jgi:hypothetical protein